MAGDAVALTISGSADDGCEKGQHTEELVTISGLVDDRAGGESSERSGDVWVHGPGGDRCEHESSISAALREAEEEAGVRGEHVRVRSTSVLDLGFWSYTTVI